MGRFVAYPLQRASWQDALNALRQPTRGKGRLVSVIAACLKLSAHIIDSLNPGGAHGEAAGRLQELLKTAHTFFAWRFVFHLVRLGECINICSRGGT